MKFRNVVLAAVTAAVLIPTISNASEKSSLDACARAFAGSFASDKSAGPAYKVAYKSSRFAGSPLEYYRREYTFDLQAHDQKSGTTVANAKCTTNNRGEVIAFVSTPVDATIQTLASR